MTDKSEQREIRLKRIRGARAFITVNNIPAIRDNSGVYLVIHAARDIVADLIEQHIELEKEAEAQKIRAEAAEQERDKLLQALRKIVAIPVPKSMDNEALLLHNIAHKALEGSNTDGRK